MRLLDRYIVRQMVAPFSFALAALTGILLLNQVAAKLPHLVGKGLPWGVIIEFFALAVPFILVMTIPMSALLATLYAFTHLAADSEITAMRASGVSVPQMLRPVLVAGVVLTAANFFLTDQIHPRTNARLRALISDIDRKKPTLGLREQTINPIPPSNYFLRASRIDAATGKMRDVAVYDLNDRTVRRVIYADSGRLAYAEGRTDLELRLQDGVIHEYQSDRPDVFQVTDFRVNTIKVHNVANSLDRRDDTQAGRGDREMGTCELLGVARDAEHDAAVIAARRARSLRGDLRALLRLPAPPGLASPPRPGPPGYCDVFATTLAFLLPETASAQRPAQRPALTPKGEAIRARKLREAARQDSLVRVDSAAIAHPPRPDRSAVGPAALTPWTQLTADDASLDDALRRRDDFLVEFWKKWAISLACLIFPLVGLPLALRFPRAGMGLVIGAGLGIFSLYYSALIGGETLAKHGFITPFWSMWTPDLVLLVLGLIALRRVSRESGSTRGGDWQDLVDSLLGRFRRAR